MGAGQPTTGELSREQVQTEAPRLFAEFQQTLNELPEFQQAVATAFWTVDGRRENRVSFRKDGMVYNVEQDGGKLEINRISETLASEGKDVYDMSGDRTRRFYGEDLSIDTGRNRDPWDRVQQGPKLGFGAKDAPTSPGFTENWSSNSQFALARIEKVLSDLRAF